MTIHHSIYSIFRLFVCWTVISCFPVFIYYYDIYLEINYFNLVYIENFDYSIDEETLMWSV